MNNEIETLTPENDSIEVLDTNELNQNSLIQDNDGIVQTLPEINNSGVNQTVSQSPSTNQVINPNAYHPSLSNNQNNAVYNVQRVSPINQEKRGNSIEYDDRPKPPWYYIIVCVISWLLVYFALGCIGFVITSLILSLFWPGLMFIIDLCVIALGCFAFSIAKKIRDDDYKYNMTVIKTIERILLFLIVGFIVVGIFIR